jgi:hypothetical protein
MSEPYEIAWATDNILVLRRRGFMSVDQAKSYFAAAKRAFDGAPEKWGLVVDTAEAATQSEEATAVLQEQMSYTASSRARRIAIVTGRTVPSMQTKRLNASAGFAPDAVTYHQFYDDAYADVERALEAP